MGKSKFKPLSLCQSPCNDKSSLHIFIKTGELGNIQNDIAMKFTEDKNYRDSEKPSWTQQSFLIV